MTEEIKGTTVLTGLLGSPVSHSISPRMHNTAFNMLGLDYVYMVFDVDEAKLPKAVEGLRALGARGFNLTMPDKNAMCELCDQLSPAARMIGAVNTVVNDGGVLTGYTTDGIGYMDAARDAGFELTGKVMTLLGGGGAATAVLAQAAIDGLKEIRVFNRPGANYKRLERIADDLNQYTKCRVTVHDLLDVRDLYDSIDSSDILTNGTPVGMTPHEGVCLIEDVDVLRPELIVSDMIYQPRQTQLLKLASDRGCPTFNGMYMLLYQGAAAFKLWTGQEMPTAHIKTVLFGE